MKSGDKCQLCGSVESIHYLRTASPRSSKTSNELEHFPKHTNSEEICVSAKKYIDPDEIKDDENLILDVYELEEEVASLQAKISRLEAKNKELRSIDKHLKEVVSKNDSETISMEKRLITKRQICTELMKREQFYGNLLLKKRMEKIANLFKLVPIEVDNLQVNRSTGSTVTLQGCSSIVQMPIPNSGNFEETPLDALSAAIQHIAHLTESISIVSNIALPHSISTFEINGPTITPQFAADSPHSLLPIILQSSREDFAYFNWNTLSQVKADEDAGRQSNTTINPVFYQGLLLLQANILTLCIKLGVPHERLWPPQAMLLNLHELSKVAKSVASDFNESNSFDSAVFGEEEWNALNNLESVLQSNIYCKEVMQSFDQEALRFKSIFCNRFDRELNHSPRQRSSKTENDAIPAKVIEDDWDIV